MPLFEVSPNIQEAQSPSRKRTRQEFAPMEHRELPALEPAGTLPQAPEPDDSTYRSPNSAKDPSRWTSFLPQAEENGWISTPKNLAPSANEDSPASLTPSGSSPADRKSVSPNPTPKHILALDSPSAPQLHAAGPKVADGTPTRLVAQSTRDAFTQPIRMKRKREDEADGVSLPPKPVLQVLISPIDTGSATASSGQPTSSGQTGTQPAKKKRATKAEMEARKAALEAEKEVKAAEKARLDAEKAAERAAEKARLDAGKQAKAEERERKKKEKEEEDAKKAEEKAKKARAQPTLASFFKMKPAAPKESRGDEATPQAIAAGSPQKARSKEVSFYEQSFKPFFVKEQVTLAALFHMDEETRDIKTRIFDEYVSGKRGHDIKVTPFDPEQALQVPWFRPRGRLYPSVRKIMAEWNDNSASKPVDLTTESQNTQIRNKRKALEDVPMKFLGFKEDVRPPYYGTITNMPTSLAGLRKLARRPVTRDVLPLQYDYDSEAEWQEEDGEDVDLMDDEEDDAENDEDMDDFLDDSEDVSLVRPALVSGLEPQSTGICWENRKRLGPKAHMYKYRMEFILDTLEHHHSIDPFSTTYWEPAKPAPAAAGTPAPSAGMRTKPDGKGMPPPSSTDAFKALGAGAVPAKKAAATLPAEMVEKLKQMVMAKKSLSRVGIIELFNSENKVPKSAIKNTIDLIAEKKGKEWVLKAGV